MNLSFPKTDVPGLQVPRRHPVPEPQPPRGAAHGDGLKAARTVIWSLLAVGGAYLLAQASVPALLAIGAMCLGLLGVAAAVCIHAQNNSW